MELLIEWIEKHIAIISRIIIPLVVAVLGLFEVRMMKKRAVTKKINKKNLNCVIHRDRFNDLLF